MIIGIYANLKRDISGEKARQLATILAQEGIDFCLDIALKFLQIDAPYYPIQELSKVCDIIVTLGGDGTILGIAEYCALNSCKIYAVNLGNLGFYTESQDASCARLINCIKNDIPLIVDKRSFLSIYFQGKEYYALNEVVIARGARTKLLKLDVQVNDNLVGKYMADGIIIATPSGSTAYSFSAGGPVVAPDVQALIITPLAPHSLQSRSYVVSHKGKIKVAFNYDGQPAHIHIDGKEIGQMDSKDSLIIGKSNRSVEFLRFEGYDYYDRLMDKMCKLGINFKQG